MLLLGLLRSAAPFLAAGTVPVVHVARKRKRGPDDDKSDDEGGDSLQEPTSERAPPRGTLLVTLREGSSPSC